eukprot:659053-Amphidinium_carterae.1
MLDVCVCLFGSLDESGADDEFADLDATASSISVEIGADSAVLKGQTQALGEFRLVAQVNRMGMDPPTSGKPMAALSLSPSTPIVKVKDAVLRKLSDERKSTVQEGRPSKA